MGSLYQEIQSFHENLKPVFVKALAQYEQNFPHKIYRTLVGPGKRLIQKCSFKSLSDAGALCSFTYWLYVYGHKELALEICECARNVDFAYESSRICGYPAILGLEIRIARELLGEDRRNRVPSKLLVYYFSKRIQKELHYPEILREEEITSCHDRLLETELLEALYNMIGKGETGLYPELNKNWGKIEETICVYLKYLKSM